MLNKNLALGAVLLMFSLHVAPASAINVDVIPSQPSLNVGEMLTADVVISDLGLFSPPSLGVFEIDLNFDNSLFAPGAVTFGVQLDLFGFGINPRGATPLASTVNVFEISLDSPSDLDTLQLDRFLLFSVQFEALSAGVGVFDLAIIELGNSVADPLFASTTSATVQVMSPNAVPVPAAVWLFGTALLGFIGMSRRTKVA
jgi:hypothetical protein